ncbi:MAG: amino acid-binding protein [Lachnospiraceae bacterium]|nr:amino acid-binding protein [Lachnospiraceae bacterium]MCR4866837.1 amino acid-binding protein [Lachnospiraceae bacterium]
MLKQVSIYAENVKGKMLEITDVLMENNVNILGSVTNDSAEYGIVRMIVDNPSKAIEALTKKGIICKMTDVIGVEVKDEVGNLNRLLKALHDANINVDYLYLSFNRESGCPIMVLHTADAKEVENSLSAKGFALC